MRIKRLAIVSSAAAVALIGAMHLKRKRDAAARQRPAQYDDSNSETPASVADEAPYLQRTSR